LLIFFLLETSIDSIIAKAMASPVQIAKTVRYASVNSDRGWLESVVGRGDVCCVSPNGLIFVGSGVGVGVIGEVVICVGSVVGVKVGAVVGERVGVGVGLEEGVGVGDGDSVGLSVGVSDGLGVGEGLGVGVVVGEDDTSKIEISM
jgi:hypothetical protein